MCLPVLGALLPPPSRQREPHRRRLLLRGREGGLPSCSVPGRCPHAALRARSRWVVPAGSALPAAVPGPRGAIRGRAAPPAAPRTHRSAPPQPTGGAADGARTARAPLPAALRRRRPSPAHHEATSAPLPAAWRVPDVETRHHRAPLREQARERGGSAMAGILFEDIFDVKDIDPEGKKFDRGELEPPRSQPLFPEPLTLTRASGRPRCRRGRGRVRRGLPCVDRPALHSVSPALRERVLQDGPHPGRQHPDLPRGPRYAAGIGGEGSWGGGRPGLAWPAARRVCVVPSCPSSQGCVVLALLGLNSVRPHCAVGFV